MGVGRLLGGVVTLGICGHIISKANHYPYGLYKTKKRKRRKKK